MTLRIFPITPEFAAEVGDVDLSQPLSGTVEQAIKAAFWQYGVLIFPDQQLSAEEHLRFARVFGPLETSIAVHQPQAKLRLAAEFADVSNLTVRDQLWGEDSRARLFALGNRLWHTDSSFRQIPAYASLLYARSIAPIGGHTEFADLRAAFDALPPDQRAALRGRVLEHSIFTSRAKLGFHDFAQAERDALPPVQQVLVRTLPQTGRESLYLASHAGRVIGLPDAEGLALIDALTTHATQRQFVYTHRWRVGDLVLWDNRCTAHRGTEFDDLRWRRDYQRVSVADVANSCAQAQLTLGP
ncbi:MAG: TauD/TfdA family dioxygenase [Gammaproteobacteria bacterium]|nr:TauD/TfdA family dioxygenase [Gammaproteobacteria bacterium]